MSCVVAVSPCFSCRGCRAGLGAASLHRWVGWSAVNFSCQKQGQRSRACILFSSPAFSSVLWSLSWQHTGCGYQQGLDIHWHVRVWKHAGVGCTNSSNKVLPPLLLMHWEVGFPRCHVKPLEWGFWRCYEKSEALEKHFWAVFWMDVFQVIRGFGLQIFTMLIQ